MQVVLSDSFNHENNNVGEGRWALRRGSSTARDYGLPNYRTPPLGSDWVNSITMHNGPICVACYLTASSAVQTAHCAHRSEVPSQSGQAEIAQLCGLLAAMNARFIDGNGGMYLTDRDSHPAYAA